ncbi:MAG TPA: universal stress protein [Mucilaginibacter sp.]|jgi:nucleotide-binding universal stress UspA family protein|nr:universal stress protein [Mucilaginibacter sp.]
MKNILILTDFTENAAHAALSGVKLSEKLHANLLLFNVNTSQPVAPNYAGGPAVVDDLGFWENESKEKLRKLSESLEPLLVQTDPEQRKPTIHFEYGEGSIGHMIKEITMQKDVEMIVMGARAGSTFEHILTGSETHMVIDNAKRPVLVVPLHTGLTRMNKVVFATDYNQADLTGIRYLAGLGLLFNFQLEVVHVNLLGENDITRNIRKNAFLNEIHKLRYSHITFREVFGKDVIHRLNYMCTELDADLLSIMHYKNSFFSKIFSHSFSKEALSNQKIPLLILPSEMK